MKRYKALFIAYTKIYTLYSTKPGYEHYTHENITCLTHQPWHTTLRTNSQDHKHLNHIYAQ